MFPDLLIESSSITELIEEVKVVHCFKNFNELDDIWAFYLGQYLYFIECAFF